LTTGFADTTVLVSAIRRLSPRDETIAIGLGAAAGRASRKVTAQFDAV
jgi:hypothetical protein